MKEELELLTAVKVKDMIKEQQLKMQNQASLDVKNYWKKHINSELHRCARQARVLERLTITVPVKYEFTGYIFIQQLIQYGGELGFNIRWDQRLHQLVFNHEHSDV
jgi:hypothetical protein